MSPIHPIIETILIYFPYYLILNGLIGDNTIAATDSIGSLSNILDSWFEMFIEFWTFVNK